MELRAILYANFYCFERACVSVAPTLKKFNA